MDLNKFFHHSIYYVHLFSFFLSLSRSHSLVSTLDSISCIRYTCVCLNLHSVYLIIFFMCLNIENTARSHLWLPEKCNTQYNSFCNLSFDSVNSIWWKWKFFFFQNLFVIFATIFFSVLIRSNLHRLPHCTYNSFSFSLVFLPEYTKYKHSRYTSHTFSPDVKLKGIFFNTFIQ